MFSLNSWRGDELPAELQRRETRLAKIQEAKAALEAEAREKAARQAEEATAKNEERERKRKSSPCRGPVAERRFQALGTL